MCYQLKGLPAQIEICNLRMADLIDRQAELVLVDSSSHHTEGPIYVPADNSVVWSDVKGDRVLRWHQNEVSVLRQNARFQNGNALDFSGRLVACSHGDRAVVRHHDNGEWRILVDRYQGKRLNSPNDLVVKSDGTIWFTDPPFGLTQADQGCSGEQEQSGSFVFRYDPDTEEMSPVVIDMIRPNGLAFSPDESVLYVSDSSAYENPQLYHHIRAYEIVDGRWATRGQTFAVIEPGEPDGLCVDAQGIVFVSAKDGVHLYASDSSYLGKIRIPEICANVALGGKHKNRLFVTAGNSLYFIDLKVQRIKQSHWQEARQTVARL